MNDFATFEVNNRTYLVNKLNAIDGLSITMKFLAVVLPNGSTDDLSLAIGKMFANPEVTSLMKLAYPQIFTPENTPLSNAQVFNDWFNQYPEDLLTVGVQGLMVLVTPFLPKAEPTTPSGVKTN
jgi:hypothetical protein